MTFDPDRPLDDIDWRLLRELQQDARLSFAELGRRIHLTAPAVAERMHRLEESGVIKGYRVEIDPAKVGYPIMAFVQVVVTGDSRRLAHFVRGLPEVLECHRVTGEHCIVMKIAASSIDHLESVVDQFVPYGQPTTSIVYSSSVDGRCLLIPPLTSHDEKPKVARRR